MDLKIRCLLLTRFNIKAAKGGHWRGGDVAYLKRRFELFEKYTFPSVRRQVAQDFTWLVLYSDSTPENMKARAREFGRQYENYIPVFLHDDDGIEVEGRDLIAEVVNEQVGDKNSWDALLTIRIDNDDAFGGNAIAEYLKTAALFYRQCEEFAIVFPYGYQFIVGDKVVQRYKYASNHFGALMTGDLTGSRHILLFNHAEISKCGFPVKFGKVRGLWLEIVHGGNLLNDFRFYCTPVYRTGVWMKKRFGFSASLGFLPFIRFVIMRSIPAKIDNQMKILRHRIKRILDIVVG